MWMMRDGSTELKQSGAARPQSQKSMELNGHWKWTLTCRSRFASSLNFINGQHKVHQYPLILPYGGIFLGMRVMDQKIERKCEHRLCAITPHPFVKESMGKIISGLAYKTNSSLRNNIIVPGSITCSLAISSGQNKLLCRRGSGPLQDFINAFIYVLRTAYQNKFTVCTAHASVLSSIIQPHFNLSVLFLSNSECASAQRFLFF